MAVAPRSFGRYAGDLILPGEVSGLIWAITPRGTVHRVTASGLPRGPDVGVESFGFVPRGATAALVADRSVPGNPYPGTNEILKLSLAGLAVRPGDLLAVAEGGGPTVRVRCSRRCTVRVVVATPSTAHIEGHVAFLRG